MAKSLPNAFFASRRRNLSGIPVTAQLKTSAAADDAVEYRLAEKQPRWIDDLPPSEVRNGLASDVAGRFRHGSRLEEAPQRIARANPEAGEMAAEKIAVAATGGQSLVEAANEDLPEAGIAKGAVIEGTTAERPLADRLEATAVERLPRLDGSNDPPPIEVARRPSRKVAGASITVPGRELRGGGLYDDEHSYRPPNPLQVLADGVSAKIDEFEAWYDRVTAINTEPLENAKRGWEILFKQGTVPVTRQYVLDHPEKFSGKVITRSLQINGIAGILGAGEFVTDQVTGKYIIIAGQNPSIEEMYRFQGLIPLREWPQRISASMGVYKNVKLLHGPGVSVGLQGGMSSFAVDYSVDEKGKFSYSGYGASVTKPGRLAPQFAEQYVHIFDLKAK